MRAIALPARPPFSLRARLLTPLVSGGHRYEADARVEVDSAGRIVAVTRWAGPADGAVDIRPWVVLPGMVDLHLHLPQLPNAGLGAAWTC